MLYVKPVLCGLAVAAMAGAVGLPSFSAEWWVFMVAGNVLGTLHNT